MGRFQGLGELPIVHHRALIDDDRRLLVDAQGRLTFILPGRALQRGADKHLGVVRGLFPERRSLLVPEEFVDGRAPNPRASLQFAGGPIRGRKSQHLLPVPFLGLVHHAKQGALAGPGWTLDEGEVTLPLAGTPDRLFLARVERLRGTVDLLLDDPVARRP